MHVHELDLLWRLGLALLLSAAIGVEREMRQKSAGLRTYTLVGLGSALFMLISGYGFSDILHGTSFDPSRIAAQIVTGIGFIGGGLIFVRRDSVRGLTTAAGVWVTAAVGMAAGGALPLLATATTAAYFLIMYGFPVLARRLPNGAEGPMVIRLIYRDGEGVLRKAMQACTERGFTVADLEVERSGDGNGNGPMTVAVLLEVEGRDSIGSLVSRLHDLDGVERVRAGNSRELAAA